MMERSSPSRRLPAYAEEVLKSLKPKIGATADGLPRDEVTAYLETEGFENSTIEVALDELLNHGYIYVVNDQIRLTDS